MKWILSHASDDIHHWQLVHEKGSDSLLFNRQWLSLRLSGTSKRLLHLQVQGLRQKRVLLQNEYGITLGETAFADKPSAGHLTLNDQTFYFKSSHDQLSLFDREKSLIATCSLPPDASLETLERYGLLFGFAWLMLPAFAEQRELLSLTN